MNKNCLSCQTQFEITEDDLKFYDNVSPIFAGTKYLIPPPTLCPDCRSRRRLAFRDERKLYRRKCDFSNKEIISIYSPDKPFTVYSNEIWWQDCWDGLSYGKEINIEKSFFDQFFELKKVVPRMQNTQYSNLNCPYGNRNANCKSCYMCFGFEESEDCYYSEHCFKLKSCIDCGTSEHLELCIGCLESDKLFKCSDCLRCSSLSDSCLCFDCHNSDNLILCWNLNQKKYCIENQQYSKEDFFQKKRELKLNCRSGISKLSQKFKEIVEEKAVHRFARIINSENCSGYNILYSKDCSDCFEISKCEGMKFVNYVPNDGRFSMDCMAIWDNAELCYESVSISSYNVQFSINVWESNDILYSDTLKCCDNCFGCTGLKHKSFCILNKQYSKHDYERLVPRIIEHMIAINEYGEFFPIHHSPFGYNESVAYEHFPIDKEQAIINGFNWYYDETKNILRNKNMLPDYIEDVSDKIPEEILYCEKSDSNYKISQHELKIYRMLKYPIPDECPDNRYKKRVSWRLPWKLWNRQCMKCEKEIKTTYSQKRPEIIYCESCYLKEVY